MHTGAVGRSLWFIGVVTALAGLQPIAVAAQASARVAGDKARLRHAVAAGSLDRVLHQIAAAAGVQLLFDPTMVTGWSAPAIPRNLPVTKALSRALAGTRLQARTVARGIIVLERLAQDNVAVPVPDSDIVVTALRRPTLLQRTGMSLTVVSGRMLAERRAYDLRGLTRLAPAVNPINTGPLQQRLSVRGVTGTGESTVATYFGEAPVSAPSGTGFDPGAVAPDVDLIDIDRIELLRGPQGTLYGAGSMGGTLRTIFNRADIADFDGEGSAEAGVTAHGSPSFAAHAIVNVPIVRGALAIRAVIGHRRTGGVIDNDRLDRSDTDRVTRESERLLASWTPSDRLDVEATWLRQRNRIDDAGVAEASAARLTTRSPVRVPNSERLSLLTTTLHWAPGPVRMTATASHYAWRIVKQLDFTRVLAGQRDSTAACTRYSLSLGEEGCGPAQRIRYQVWLDTRLPGALYQPMSVDGTSGELRFDNGDGGPDGWTAGVFIEHRADEVASYAVRSDAGTGLVLEPLDVTGVRLIETVLDQQALFAEWRHRIAPDLTLTFGGRVYRYHRSASGSTPIPNIITGTGAITSGDSSNTEKGANGKVELTWASDGKPTVYVIVAEGFRPGGVNITPELNDDERAYRADHLWSYEIGVKTPPWGGLTLEASAYHINWENTIFATTSANGAFVYNTNLTSVAITGGEGRVAWSGARVRLSATAAYVDARLTADTLLGTSDGVGQRGDRLPNVPRVTYALLWDWAIDASPDAAHWTLGGALGGNGAMHSTFSRDSAFHERTPARVLVDAYLLYRRGAWSARLGVDNMFDALAPSRISSSNFGIGQIYAARPRTVTLGLTRRFR